MKSRAEWCTTEKLGAWDDMMTEGARKMVTIDRDYRRAVEALKSEDYAEARFTALADLERKHVTGEIEDLLYNELHEQLLR